MNFDKAVEVIIDLEGGYTANEKDPGGETKYGISKKAYPNLDIKNISLDQAKEIYRQDYWNKVSGDLLPKGLSLLVFDAAVNHGIETAAIILQRVVMAKPDGVIGPVTLEAMQGMNIYALIQAYALERHRYYISSKNWEVFGRGWSKRLLTVALLSGEIAC